MRLAVDQKLSLAGHRFRVGRHPLVASSPHVIRGDRSDVYRLIGVDEGETADSTGAWALKLWRDHRHASSEDWCSHLARDGTLRLLPDRLIQVKELEGRLLHTRLLTPWQTGPTWADFVTGHVALTQASSLRLATALAKGLAELERSGSAHCELTGQHLIMRQVATLGHDQSPIGLVGFGHLYGPHLRPAELPISPYTHPKDRSRWGPYGHRYAAALLLTEILGWCDPGFRAAAVVEGFWAGTVGSTGNRDLVNHWLLCLEVLEQRWGKSIAALAAQAMSSADLTECPCLAEWEDVLQCCNGASDRPVVTPTLSWPKPLPVTVRSSAIGAASTHGQWLTGVPTGVSAIATAYGPDKLLVGAVDGAVWIASSATSPPDWRHSNALTRTVQALIAHPSADWWAAAAERSVAVWHRRNSQPSWLLPHSQPVTALACSTSLGALVTGSVDQRVRVWSTSDGVLLSERVTAVGAVTALVVSPDATQVVVAGYGGVEVFPLLQSRRGERLSGTTAVRSLACHPRASAVAGGGADGSLSMWSLTTGALQFRVKAHQDAVNAVAFAPDGSQIATGALDGSVRLWTARGEPITTLPGQRTRVEGICYAAGGELLYSATYEGVRSWTVPRTQLSPSPQPHMRGATL